jgi:hypothetical protein
MKPILTIEEAIELITPKLQAEKEEFDKFMAENNDFRSYVYVQAEEYRKDPLVIIASDVSQAEVRVMAQLSGEQKLIDIYNNQYKNLQEGKNIDEMREVDFHYVTASNIYKKPVNKISKSERRNAKSITFALLYGSSEMGIAERTDLTVKEAKELLNNFWKSYSQIRTWVGNNLEFAIKHGYIKTPMGRRKYTPILKGKHQLATNFWNNEYLGKNVPYDSYIRRIATSEARQCQNYPIQSFTSDIVLLGTYLVEQKMKEEKIFHYLHTIIHDSIVMSVRFSEIKKVAKIIHWVFEKKIPEMLHLSLPMLMEVEVGFNFFSTVKLPFDVDFLNMDNLKTNILEAYKNGKGKVSFKQISDEDLQKMLTSPAKKIKISKQILKKYNHDEKSFHQQYSDYVQSKQLKLTPEEVENILELMKLS